MDQLEEMLGDEDEEGDGGGGVVRFCFQHAKQAMRERGCFVSPREGRSKWVEFDDWILPDLPVQTKILLRHEMAMPVSAKDEEGYIYVHEMVTRLPTSLRTTHLKLGRSIHPITRLSQWRSQCPSREPIVRAIFPLHSSSSALGGVGVSGALRVAERGTRNHHRWERLVLIEVAGRAEMEMTLLGGGGGGGRKECRDCGRVHLELFEVGEGAFDEWVAEVVERWGRWCADVLG
ncbi:hypothetical protein BCR35DRAFT_293838 [Leucosporidium creatinivorum]|uniref:Bacteriophage T5 Orf172 DNA-binding domain-containing protein n=1 Tax=Leucosporidium creatinivorum TaxID=106004 RepID=A0A1Y2ENY6_9BASI|nr:hypothetical protein BCR35DRAFT_293838 [Leucosporidium creatinivorum]